jgi:DNA-directed RNA polymerase subunit RPC12/RpoP
MSACRKCGQEISFRYIDGILRPLHAYGSPCGEALPFTDESLKRSVHIRCPRCPQMVYLVRHNGGSVWLDELGWPWPKHGCFDSQPHDSGNTSVAPIPSVMFSVTEKGALSVRGMGEFPVTLHREQWLQLLGQADAIREFISKHRRQLKRTPSSL